MPTAARQSACPRLTGCFPPRHLRASALIACACCGTHHKSCLQGLSTRRVLPDSPARPSPSLRWWRPRTFNHGQAQPTYLHPLRARHLASPAWTCANLPLGLQDSSWRVLWSLRPRRDSRPHRMRQALRASRGPRARVAHFPRFLSRSMSERAQLMPTRPPHSLMAMA